MITVLRGRGVIEAGREKQSLRAGTWLLLGPVDKIDLTAHAGESLVLTITWNKHLSEIQKGGTQKERNIE